MCLLQVDGWNDGRSKKTHKFKALANSSDALTLPTKRKPHVLKVKSSKVKKIIAGAVAVVIGASLGTGFVYARRNPGITQASASLQSDDAVVLCLWGCAPILVDSSRPVHLHTDVCSCVGKIGAILTSFLMRVCVCTCHLCMRPPQPHDLILRVVAGSYVGSGSVSRDS